MEGNMSYYNNYRRKVSLSDRWSKLSGAVKLAVGLAALALVAFLLWATAPLTIMQWFWVRLIWMHPIGWLLTVASLVILGVLITREHTTAVLVFASAACIGLILYATLANGLMRWYLVKDINPTMLTALPNTTEVRYLPKPVAERFGANKVQDPRHHFGDMDPLDTGGELDWVAPQVPTGFWNALGGQTDGFQVVKPSGQVETIHQPMKYGEGMFFRDNIKWPLWRIHYLVELPEFYYVRQNDEVLTIAPYIRYVFKFPVRMPTWGGVFVVHADGRIEDLSPERAIVDSRLVGQRLYPELLALKIADAWAYRNGVWNAWFLHKDQTEVPTITDEANQMPYLLPTAEGPVWFIGMEPYGPAYSVFKMLFLDAHAGKISLYQIQPESGITGPNRASGYVRSAFPGYQWYSKGEKSSYGNMLAIEPKPLIRNGILYWQVSLTNVDYAGVTATALVNGSDNSVIYFKTLEEIEQFVAGKFQGHSPSGEMMSASSGQSPQPSTNAPADLQGMTSTQLYDLQRQIINELERRQK
jgi:hypothetical protein